jgi:hypothetical protein
MPSRFAVAENPLAPKLGSLEELSIDGSLRDDFGRIGLIEIRESSSNAPWQPSSGIRGNIQSSLSYRLPYRDGIAADALAWEPRTGLDSGYMPIHPSDEGPFPEGSLFGSHWIFVNNL